MEFKLCFDFVQLMAYFTIYGVADTFGFAGHGLFDDVLIAIICTGDEGIEQP